MRPLHFVSGVFIHALSNIKTGIDGWSVGRVIGGCAMLEYIRLKDLSIDIGCALCMRPCWYIPIVVRFSHMPLLLNASIPGVEGDSEL